MTRVVLTQPQPRCARLAQRLRARGHEVLELSLRRLQRLPQAPSPAALSAALDDERAEPPAWPHEVGLAVVGPGSAQALAELGLAPPTVRVAMPAAAPYDAQALLRTPPFDAPAGLRILVLPGERGGTDWLDELRARGAGVDSLALYRGERLQPGAEAIAALRGWAQAQAAAVFVFTVAEVAGELDRLLHDAGLAGWARCQRALAVHPRIAESLEKLGWRAVRPIDPGERALTGGIESA